MNNPVNKNVESINIDCRDNVEKYESVILIADNDTDTKPHTNKADIHKDTLCNTTIDILSNEDKIIDIEVTEDPKLPYDSVRKKQTSWTYWQVFTVNFWQKQPQQGNTQGPMQDPMMANRWTQYGQTYRGYSGTEDDNMPLMYDPATKNSFVCLVMVITMIMLLLSAGFVAFVLYSPDVRHIFRANTMMFLLLAFVLYLIPSYGMACYPMCRAPPCSFIMLLLALCSMSLMAAAITCHYETIIVLQALVATAAIVLVCVALACTSFDFTKYLLYLVVISAGVAVASLIVFATFLITGKSIVIVHLIILIVSVIIQAVLLVIELQMILGGKSIELSEDDYAFGAFMLYTSIMDIFIKMVQIIGLANH